MIHSKVGGAYSAPLNSPNSPAANFASQGDAHVRTDARIKFLYYTLSRLQNLCIIKINSFKKKHEVINIAFLLQGPFVCN